MKTDIEGDAKIIDMFLNNALNATLHKSSIFDFDLFLFFLLSDDLNEMIIIDVILTN